MILGSRFKNCVNFAAGEMAERSIAAVLKTVVGKTTGGSNPSLSAESTQSPSKHWGFLFSPAGCFNSKTLLGFIRMYAPRKKQTKYQRISRKLICIFISSKWVKNKNYFAKVVLSGAHG